MCEKRSEGEREMGQGERGREIERDRGQMGVVRERERSAYLFNFITYNSFDLIMRCCYRSTGAWLLAKQRKVRKHGEHRVSLKVLDKPNHLPRRGEPV